MRFPFIKKYSLVLLCRTQYHARVVSAAAQAQQRIAQAIASLTVTKGGSNISAD